MEWYVKELLEARKRIRTLENALRPFAYEATAFTHHVATEDSNDYCVECDDDWPCSYEIARRALYPDTERTPE